MWNSVGLKQALVTASLKEEYGAEKILLFICGVGELLGSIGMILSFLSDSLFFFFLSHSLVIFFVCGKLQAN